jgi:hypothetical protein
MKQIIEQRQQESSYFFLVRSGWYYLISVLDDYARFIPAWKLKLKFISPSIIQVVQ